MIDPLLALSFLYVIVLQWLPHRSSIHVHFTFIHSIPTHSFGKAKRLDDRETEYVPDDAQCESAPLTSLKKHLTKSSEASVL